jgi:hypothetical protein
MCPRDGTARAQSMKEAIMKTQTSLVAVAATLVAFTVGGCAPEAGATAEAKAETKTETASASGLQSCADIGRLDAVVGDSVTTACEIKLTGLDEGSSFKVEIISGTVTEEGIPGEDSMVRVTKMVGGDAGQVMEETPVTLLVAPDYRDVNGDGEGDLLISRDIGNVNAVYGVWFGSPDGGPYYRVGEVAGEFGDVTSDGYMTVSARSSASTQCVSFYSMADQQLSLQASACVTAKDEAATQTECVLEEVEAVNPLEINEENRAKFCAEPAAANVFK